MTVTRLERKQLKNVSRAKARKARMKFLTSVPVSRKVDIEAIKAQFFQNPLLRKSRSPHLRKSRPCRLKKSRPCRLKKSRPCRLKKSRSPHLRKSRPCRLKKSRSPHLRKSRPCRLLTAPLPSVEFSHGWGHRDPRKGQSFARPSGMPFSSP